MHNNKKTDGLVNRLASNLEILNQAHRVAWPIGQEKNYNTYTGIRLLIGKGTNTLSGRIGKVVASHAAVARSVPAEVAPIYTMHEALRGYCP